MSLQSLGTPEYINVSQGLVPNTTRSQRNGYSAVIASSFQTIWNEAAVVVFPAAAGVLTVSSSSSNDTAAGTGARTVSITGLDAAFNPLTETVILNGTTAVSTLGSYFRVNSITVTTVGSGGSNAGIIYIGTGLVTAGKPATIYNSIPVGFNVSSSGFITIANNTTSYLLQLLASTDTAGTQVQLLTRTVGGVFLVARNFLLGTGAGTNQVYSLPRALTAGTDIMIQAMNAGTNVKVACQFELLQIFSIPT